MNLPKGIINIITDYTHTLFYIKELKNKIQGMLSFTNNHICYERHYKRDCFTYIVYPTYLNMKPRIKRKKNGWWIITYSSLKEP